MNSILPLIFLITYIYGIAKSKQKLMAALFPVGCMAGAFLFGAALAWMIPRQAPAIGTMTGLMSSIVGIVASIAARHYSN